MNDTSPREQLLFHQYLKYYMLDSTFDFDPQEKLAFWPRVVTQNVKNNWITSLSW
jgi:hypothetical protein